METSDQNNCIGFDGKSLKEAIKTLSSYNAEPFTIKFMNYFSMPIPDTVRKMHGYICRRIKNKTKRPNFEDLMEYIDKIKMLGRQHIFLFALKSNEEEYLKRLSDPAHIKERLHAFDLEDRYNKNICIWKTKGPILAEVKHVIDQRNEGGWLSFKWIETRQFEHLEKKTINTIDERSANFFIINLKDGSSQLHIQSLKPRPLIKLREEFKIYIEEIKKFIEFHRFTSVSLEPIMKKFLYRSILPISRWSITLKSGDLHGSKASPSLIEKLKLPFQNFYGNEITTYWKCRQKAHNRDKLFITLDGYNNRITFNSITDKSRVDFILSEFHKVDKENLESDKIEMKELKKLAEEDPERFHLFFVMDYYFSKLTRRRIDSKILISETWFSDKIIKAVFQRAAEKFPRKFAVIFQKNRAILEIKNRFNTKDGLQDHLIRKFEDTPKEKIKKFATKSSLFLSLISGTIIPALAEEVIEKLIGMSFIVVQIFVFIILLFFFYGGKKIKIIFYKIPRKYVLKALKITFAEQSGIAINNAVYNDWISGQKRRKTAIAKMIKRKRKQ